MKFSKKQIKLVLLDIFYPKGFSAKMGRLIGALSIIALLNNSFHLGLVKTFQMLIGYYDEFVNFLFSWTEPYVHRFTHYISSLVNLHIVLNKIWHHVFVLMWILFMRDSNVAYTDGRKKLSVIRGITGFLISLVFSFLATVEISSLGIRFRNAQLSIIPYLGIYFYDLIMYAYSTFSLIQNNKNKSKRKGKEKIKGLVPSRWDHFKRNSVRAHWRFALIISTIFLCFAITSSSSLSFPYGGFLILSIATIVNFLYWVVRGILYARKTQIKESRDSNRSLYSLFNESEAGRFALAVGGVIAWTITFVALNTGAKILGL